MNDLACYKAEAWAQQVFLHRFQLSFMAWSDESQNPLWLDSTVMGPLVLGVMVWGNLAYRRFLGHWDMQGTSDT